jgi:glycosyltransferase involved in cell wall biosynthesis
MKIIVAHNRYQHRGGEDSVFDNEVELLTTAGHEVHPLVISNDTIKSPRDKILAMFRTVANPNGMAMMSAEIEKIRPDLVHVHNFFPLLSPAVYSVCHAAKVPVLQTLHNFRPICANGLLMRNGEICHLCVNSSIFWGVFYRCYRGSIAGSLATARMIWVHNKRKTWVAEVDHYIALSEFSRRIFIDAGFPEDCITVKPNFIKDPGCAPTSGPREGALYVGRLSEEKGLRLLLEASARYNFPLRIAGAGPELSALKSLAPVGTVFLGNLTREAVFNEMKRAAVVVIPSLCYENCPVVVLESFACATPVIGSRFGALTEIIEDGVTGFLVPRADSAALGDQIRRALANPHLLRKLGNSARRVFLDRFTPEINLKLLEDIYRKLVQKFRAHNRIDDFGVANT